MLFIHIADTDAVHRAQGSGEMNDAARIDSMNVDPYSSIIPDDDERLSAPDQFPFELLRLELLAFQQKFRAVTKRNLVNTHLLGGGNCERNHRDIAGYQLRLTESHQFSFTA